MNRCSLWPWQCFLAAVFQSALQSAQPFFVESFESAAQNLNLESYPPYYTVQGGVLQRQPSGEFSDRRYLRTVAADYHVRNFTFELTCTTNHEFDYLGIGAGIRSGPYNEPGNSVFLALHPQSLEGRVVIRTAAGDVQIDRLYSAGPHRVRIEKKGTAISFQVDEGYDGNFTADIS